MFDNPLIKPVQMFKAGQILNEMPSSIEPVTWLDAVLETDPGRIFIETPDGKTYTYQDLADMSGRIASTLALRSVVAG
ncbi:MAG: hypothetical protein ACREUJ_10140, partial [Burkholderiales bacterium]